MKILVAYATKHGATRGIAERIAHTLETDGLEVTVGPVAEIERVDGFDAYVIGSAAYMGGWLKQATAFVRRHRDTLAGHPIWLFSSGPVGPDVPGKDGVDPRTASEPREFSDLDRTLPSRDKRVFFGKYVPDLSEGSVLGRLAKVIPAVKDALPAGDFRDWPAIEAWAHEIARELADERTVELAHA